MEKTSALAAAANAAGFSYLAFNNRGAHQLHRLYRKHRDKKEKIPAGTAYELIKDCVRDIDGAVALLKKRGYSKFYLIGFSTGANKICAYSYLKPKNKISGNILVCGGDDAGVYYRTLGKTRFTKLLSESREKVRQKKGTDLIPYAKLGSVMSYQSYFDTVNPDGDYNTFPYNEATKGLRLSKKKLFRHFASIKKPSLVVYGSEDEYLNAPVDQAMGLLKENCADLKKFKFVVIQGADHGFNGKSRELNKTIEHWLKNQAK